MRFTATWSTLKNTFIFSAIALLSLAPAANADTDIEFTAPLANERVGMNTVYTVKWHTVRGVYPELHGILGNLWLRNADESIPIYALAAHVALLNNIGWEDVNNGWGNEADVYIPNMFPPPFPGMVPGKYYYIQFHVSDGWYFNSRYFDIIVCPKSAGCGPTGWQIDKNTCCWLSLTLSQLSIDVKNYFRQLYDAASMRDHALDHAYVRQSDVRMV